MSNQDMPVTLKKFDEEIKKIETEVKDEIMNTNSKKDCEAVGNNGVYFNNTCHFYSILHRICMKINFYDDLTDDSKLSEDRVFYDGGCFTGLDPLLFK